MLFAQGNNRGPGRPAEPGCDAHKPFGTGRDSTHTHTHTHTHTNTHTQCSRSAARVHLGTRCSSAIDTDTGYVMEGLELLLPMAASHIPACLTLQLCYPSCLHEPSAKYEGRLNAYPRGCWVAVQDGAVVGYVMSHPWAGASVPCVTSKEVPAIPPQPDCYFLFDMCVTPAFRGRGVGAHLAAACEREAHRLGLRTLRLVAVLRAETYWRRLGFEVEPGGEVVGEGYAGVAAVRMRRELEAVASWT